MADPIKKPAAESPARDGLGRARRRGTDLAPGLATGFPYKRGRAGLSIRAAVACSLSDPLARTIEVYRREGERWVVAGTYEGSGMLRLEPFAAVEVDVRRWWREA